MGKLNLSGIILTLSLLLTTACGVSNEPSQSEEHAPPNFPSKLSQKTDQEPSLFFLKSVMKNALVKQCEEIGACEKHSRAKGLGLEELIKIDTAACQNMPSDDLRGKECKFEVSRLDDSVALSCELELHERIGQHSGYWTYERYKEHPPGIHKSSMRSSENSLKCSTSVAKLFKK